MTDCVKKKQARKVEQQQQQQDPHLGVDDPDQTQIRPRSDQETPLTQELHLPLSHALHLHSGEVRQVVVLVPQGVLLQAEGGQTSGSVPTGENTVGTI